jgi:hypothetical protein
LLELLTPTWAWLSLLESGGEKKGDGSLAGTDERSDCPGSLCQVYVLAKFKGFHFCRGAGIHHSLKEGF